MTQLRTSFSPAWNETAAPGANTRPCRDLFAPTEDSARPEPERTVTRQSVHTLVGMQVLPPVRIRVALCMNGLDST
jgi:hypothetical protein